MDMLNSCAHALSQGDGSKFHPRWDWEARYSNDSELSLSILEECRRDTKGSKGVKGFLLVGQEKVPRRFRLRTGGRSGDTADGAGHGGRPAS